LTTHEVSRLKTATLRRLPGNFVRIGLDLTFSEPGWLRSVGNGVVVPPD
jgi:hypothetical protein